MGAEVIRTADISADGVYRYRLSREWGNGTNRALFVMLNPSTADHTKDDPTIRKCIGFAMRWSMDAIDVVNLYALRSTDPKAIWVHPEPIGPENNARLEEAARASTFIVAAWGSNMQAQGRGAAVVEVLRRYGTVYAIKRTLGPPWHPLYVPWRTDPVVFAEHADGR
jgi:hypothetical protein